MSELFALIEQLDEITDDLATLGEMLELRYAAHKSNFLISGVLENAYLLAELYNEFCLISEIKNLVWKIPCLTDFC